MSPEQRAYQIVCDTFGAESGWEYVTRWIAAAVSEAEDAVRSEYEAQIKALEVKIKELEKFTEEQRLRIIELTEDRP